MKDGDPEDGHDGIANELLDRSTVALDDRPDHREVAAHDRAHRLGIELLAEDGGARHVGEEDSDGLAYLARDKWREGRGRHQGRPTRTAEAGFLGVGRMAHPAASHRRMVRVGPARSASTSTTPEFSNASVRIQRSSGGNLGLTCTTYRRGMSSSTLPTGPTPEAIRSALLERYPETVVAEALGATFFSLAESHWPTHATIVTTDEHDVGAPSNPARARAFRRNIGVGRETFERLVGSMDRPDSAAYDRILPHPVYAKQRWIS